MSSRVGFRLLQASRPTFRSQARVSMRQTSSRRYQSADASSEAAKESVFQRLWHSPIGIRTVHFWAPIMKWGIVLAGISDLMRPAESLSVTQNAALMMTGAIWTRWCFIIKPRNLFLATVNFFLFCVGATQVTRIAIYRSNQKEGSTPDAVKAVAEEQKDAAMKVTEKTKEAVV